MRFRDSPRAVMISARGHFGWAVAVLEPLLPVAVWGTLSVCRRRLIDRSTGE
ncbi:hypothetical protein [Streptomyces sp. NPDC051219]|uniref:hypothetical protein n=1 Tax=Streptomyces sp. NPDC051219 TaxID=3155283 RepID=UPI00341AEFCE